MTLPWDKNYVQPEIDPKLADALKQVTEQVTQEVTTATTAAAAQAETAAGQAEEVIPSGVVGMATHHLPAPGIQAIEDAARSAAQNAVQSVVPALQATVTEWVQNEAAKLPTPTVTHLDPKDLLHASARSRALRTFFIGLALTVVWALVTMLGQVGEVDWFSKQGWTSVVTLAIGSVGSAVASYVARVVAPPDLAKVPGGG